MIKQVELQILAITTTAMVVLIAFDPATAQTIDLERIEAITDSLVNIHISSGITPGMSVAIAKDGEIIFSQGYGRADVELDVAASPETVYRIGSVTKQFTAATIMRLAEVGRLSLDDSITKYLPDYPTQGHKVTVRHLLNHTSGITDRQIRNEKDMQRLRLDLQYKEMIDLFAEEPFNFTPGEKFEYNNFAYYLLSEIISRVTGEPWWKYMERDVLQPLGLDYTLYCDAHRIVPNRAEGYEYEGSKLVNDPYIDVSFPGGAGAFCSTISDLVRWTYFLHNGEIISSASLEQMTTPTKLASGATVGYGYGLRLDKLGEHRKIYHGGVSLGFSSYLVHYPENGLTIVILANSGEGKQKIEEIEEMLARSFFGLEIADLPLTVEDIERYEGAYTMQIESEARDVKVFSDGKHLMMWIAGIGESRLRYQGDHSFIPVVDGEIRYVFFMENGRAAGIKAYWGRREFHGARKPNSDNARPQDAEVLDLPLAAEDLVRYEGVYNLQMGSQSRDLRVFSVDGELRVQIGEGNETRLRYQGDHVFIPVANDNTRYVFKVEEGRAEGATIQLGDRTISGQRKQ